MELDINRQIGATSPVMQMQNCQVEQGAEAETLNLPINLCSNPKIQEQVLASDQQNEAINRISVLKYLEGAQSRIADVESNRYHLEYLG